MRIIMLCIYWVIAGIIAYRNGLAPAAFYLGGYGILVVVSIVYELKMKGLLPENYWTDSSLFIGVAIESVILSFALANKFNFYKKEKERLQNEAYQQATRFSRELISMQEAERKRIASELHDSLGQKLVLIKNKILDIIIRDKRNTTTIGGHIESECCRCHSGNPEYFLRIKALSIRPIRSYKLN